MSLSVIRMAYKWRDITNIIWITVDSNSENPVTMSNWQAESLMNVVENNILLQMQNGAYIVTVKRLGQQSFQISFT